MKKRLWMAAMALFVLIVAGSTWAAPEKVVLRFSWWGNPTRDARTLEVIKLYMAKNPNVDIEPETTSWAGYWDKLATQAAANNLPDIIQHDYTYIQQYANKKLLLDLTPYIKAKKINLENVADSYLASGRIKNEVYGVSLGTNATCIIYDPAILQKSEVTPPTLDWTWRDFEKMALQIHKKTGVQTIPFGTTDPRLVFEHWARQTGKSMFARKDGSALGFSDAKLLTEFFAMQLRLLKAGALIDPGTAFIQVTPQEHSFVKGKSWLNFIQSNQVISYQEPAKRPVSIAAFPKIPKSKRPGTFFKPSMLITISRSTTHKEEAAKFANYFLNDLEANNVLKAERGIPIIPKVRESLAEKLDPVNKQIFGYVASLENKKYNSPIDPPDPPGTGEVLKILRTIEQEVLFGVVSPSDGAVKFIKKANEILAKNKQ